MKNENDFNSVTDILKRILAENGVDVDNREKTAEELLEESRKSCQFQCDWENNKIGKLNEYDGYDCPLCKNKGYFVKPKLYLKRYTEEQVMCSCRKARKSIMALKKSGLEDLVEEYRFDNYEAKEQWQKIALETAMRYTENYKDHWLFLGGATGRGKTHLCTAAAISLLKKGNEVKYMLWRDESRRLKSIVNEPEYNKEIQFYKSVDVLYIDDLFKTGRAIGKNSQMPTEADINLAFEIINNRAMQRKPTIISSESNLLELLEIDEAIGGRIKQRCGEYYFNIGSKNTKNYRME